MLWHQIIQEWRQESFQIYLIQSDGPPNRKNETSLNNKGYCRRKLGYCGRKPMRKPRYNALNINIYCIHKRRAFSNTICIDMPHDIWFGLIHLISMVIRLGIWNLAILVVNQNKWCCIWSGPWPDVRLINQKPFRQQNSSTHPMSAECHHICSTADNHFSADVRRSASQATVPPRGRTAKQGRNGFQLWSPAGKPHSSQSNFSGQLH